MRDILITLSTLVATFLLVFTIISILSAGTQEHTGRVITVSKNVVGSCFKLSLSKDGESLTKSSCSFCGVPDVVIGKTYHVKSEFHFIGCADFFVKEIINE